MVTRIFGEFEGARTESKTSLPRAVRSTVFGMSPNSYGDHQDSPRCRGLGTRISFRRVRGVTGDPPNSPEGYRPAEAPSPSEGASAWRQATTAILHGSVSPQGGYQDVRRGWRDQDFRVRTFQWLGEWSPGFSESLRVRGPSLRRAHLGPRWAEGGPRAVSSTVFG